MKNSFMKVMEADKKTQTPTTATPPTSSTSSSEEEHRQASLLAQELNLDPMDDEVQRLVAIQMFLDRREKTAGSPPSGDRQIG
jgi:hypothetical protein